MSRIIIYGALVCVFALSITAFIMSITNATTHDNTSICRKDRDEILNRLANIFSVHDSALIPSIFSDDAYVDITPSGAPGPLTGTAQIDLFFQLLLIVIRSQTVLITNPISEGNCPGPVLVQFHSLQAMEQVLQMGDMFLPAFITGSSLNIEFAPDGRISSIVMDTLVTQAVVSPNFNGVINPPVKKRNTIIRTTQELWILLQQWISNANAHGHIALVYVLQNTTAYTNWSQQYTKKNN